MQPQQSQQNSLDPQAVNLAKAIRQTESGGNFQAQGKSGEYGAYQYTEPTWAKDSVSAGVNVPLNQATPEQQNEVAYKKIKALKDQGYNVGQIASIWNSGDSEAYKGTFSNGKPSSSTADGGKPNSYGVKYDVPAYAKSVATAYQTLKGGGQVSADPNNPSSVNSTENAQVKTKETPPQDNTYGALNPASSTDTPLQAGLKATENVPSSLFNLGKNLFTTVAHPIKTIEGLGNAFAGGIEEGWNKLTGGQANNTQTQTFDALKKSLYDRYGTLENAQKTATNDPAGFGADVLTILEGGASIADRFAGAGAETAGLTGDALASAQKANTPVSSALNSGLSTIAKPVVSAIKYPFGLAKDATVGLLGGLTGKGGGAVGEAYNAGANGSYQTFMKSLMGGSDPEKIVGEAKDALGQLVDERKANYQDMLSNIKADPTTYDVSPINDEIQKQLKAFNISPDANGDLDFSRSTIRFNTTAQNDIQKIVDTMKSFGTKAGDRTALGVDNLKQAFGDLYSDSSKVRSFVQNVTKKTRSILDGTPGYTDAMANYGDLSDQIESITKSLSLGDSAQAETSFNKLIQAVKGNNPIKTQLLQELNQISGGELIPKISGSMLSPGMSKGILGHLAEVGGVGALVGGEGIMPLIISMMTTSPKLVGALVATLGLGAGKTAQIMNLLSKAVLPANAVGRLNPSPQNAGLISTQ